MTTTGDDYKRRLIQKIHQGLNAGHVGASMEEDVYWVKTMLGRDKPVTHDELRRIAELMTEFSTYKRKKIYKVKVGSNGKISLHMDSFGGKPCIRLKDLETMPDTVSHGLDGELKASYNDHVPKVDGDE